MSDLMSLPVCRIALSVTMVLFAACTQRAETPATKTKTKSSSDEIAESKSSAPPLAVESVPTPESEAEAEPEVAPEVEPEVEPEVVPEPEVEPEPPPAAASDFDVEADAMYFILDDPGLSPNRGGLVRLGPEGRFERIRDYGAALAAAPDGVLYLLSWLGNPIGAGEYGIEVLSKDKKYEIVLGSAVGSLVSITPLASGHVWAVGGKGVGYYDGTEWTITSRDAFGKPPEHLTIDGTGTVWVHDGETLYRRVEQGFEATAPPEIKAPRLNHFIDGGGDDLVLSRWTPGGPLRYSKGVWSVVQLDVPGQPVEMIRAIVRLEDGGLIAAPAKAGVLYVVPGSGGAARLLTLKALGVPASRVEALSIDGRGRLWAATDVGIVVLEPDLATLAQWYPRGSVPAIKGQVDSMLARGEGPSLPTPGPVDGRVRGKLRRKGEPLANVDWEMCGDPLRGNLGSASSPCDMQSVDMPQSFTGKTDADGKFELWEVPSADYYVAVQIGHDWRVTRASRCCSTMKAGETFELVVDVP